MAALNGVRSVHRFGVESAFADTLHALRVDALFWSGQWAAVEEGLEPDGLDGRGLDMVIGGSVAAAWHTAAGRFDVAQDLFDRCRAAANDGALTGPMSFLWIAMAEWSLWRGDPASARDLVEMGLARAAHSDHGVLLGRLYALGARAVADLEADAVAEAMAGDVARLADRLTPSPFAGALVAQARAELGRARGENAASHWAAVAGCWSALRVPYHQAYARWRQAEALLAGRGSRPSAARVLAEARELATGLGAVPLRTEVDALARRARLDLTDVAPVRPRATVATDVPGLTPREEQVLALIGQGSTNRQIARQLFISENTVSIHVSRVLATLGVPTRVAAAAAATRLGLDQPRP
jgi:DNA-binding CsgD family transcriptional regulator